MSTIDHPFPPQPSDEAKNVSGSELRCIDGLCDFQLSPQEVELARHMPAFIAAIAGESFVGPGRIQRQLRCGYNWSCDLLEFAEKLKLVGPIDDRNGKRPVLHNNKATNSGA